MRIISVALSATVVAIALAGCSGSPQVVAPGSPPGSAGRWMAPNVANRVLIYLSNSSTVTVYSWRPLQLVGTLTGLPGARGLCSDASGDVYVTEAGASAVVEYAHGGTTPIQTLADPDGSPTACAVDPTTGDLAVANVSSSDAAGSVLVYGGSSGSPAQYTDPNIYAYFYMTYDDRGNLFVDGQNTYDPSSSFEFAELPARGNALVDITLDQSIEYPGGVAWDGKYVAVGDQDTNNVYAFAISGSAGTLMATTALQNVYDVTEFWIPKLGTGTIPRQYNHLVGADFGSNVRGRENPGQVALWSYPSGGAPLRTNASGSNHPVGVTVSLP
jgi:hypothetical protein